MTDGVSIDRTSLSLSPLTIGLDGSGTYSLTQVGLGRPAITPRATYFPDSRDVDGSKLQAVVREQSSLPLEVLVQGVSAAALDTAINDLDAAVWQFTYDTTVTIGGVAKVWHCTPAAWAPTSGLVEHAHVEQFFEVLTLTIPVYPIPS